MLRRATIILGLCGSVLTEARVLAQQPTPTRPRVRAVRTATPPRIDGRLDDACWKQAGLIPNLRQSHPVQDADPTERTEIRILYDNENLYFGLRCFDSNPKEIRATHMRRDGSLHADDRIFIWLDPFDNQRSGYEFAFNAAGATTDALVERRSTTPSWDGIYDHAARIDAKGWTVEFRLPLATLSFAADHTTWGMNITRFIRRKNEGLRWSYPYHNRTGRDFAVAGRLEGLVGLRPTAGLDFKPYGLVRMRRDKTDKEDYEADAGFDLRYRLTPGMTATLTYNTDSPTRRPTTGRST